MAEKGFALRLDNELLDKLFIVAEYEGRSANSQIMVLVRQCVEEYEEKHGKIELGKKAKDTP